MLPFDRIHWLSAELRRTFGGKVVKVPLDAGFTCPNRDGTLGRGGCAWCDPGGSGPDGPGRVLPVIEQLRLGTRRALDRGAAGTIAYLQAFSNTHGPAEKILRTCEEALGVPGILGIAVATRPDCLPEPVLDALAGLNRRTFLWVEVGMQTRWDATLAACNRGHSHFETVRALGALDALGIRTVLHLILGLPGESREMIRESLIEAARLGPWGIKLHPLHIVRGSALEAPWLKREVPLLTLEAYVSLVADGLEILPPATTVHRLTGERPAEILLAPDWCRDKRRVLGAIQRDLARRGSRQGCKYRTEN